MAVIHAAFRGILAMALVLFAFTAHAELLAGTVVDISDGDTLRIRSDGEIVKIRLKGIDAPEMTQPFGPESRRHLSDLTFLREAVANCPVADKYGRRVCTVYIADPACIAADCPKDYDVNLAQIEACFAWWYRWYADEQPLVQRVAYEIAENHARLDRLGLWNETDAMAPWAWRRR